MAKHNTKYNIKSYYDKFIELVLIKQAPIIEERKEIYVVKLKLYDKIMPHKKELLKIRGLFNFLRSIQFTPNMYNESKHKKYARLVKSELENSQLAMNCVAIMEYTARDFQCKKQIKDYEAALITSGAYKKILDAYYEYISKWILQGYIFYVGPHLGKIYIKERYKNFINELGETRAMVDYAKSYAILEEIAYKQEQDGMHKLYSQYKELHVYNRKQFTHAMKAYTYSPDKPDLPKWIVYHTDDWIPYFIWGNKDSTISELSKYTFKPTSFINTKIRNKELFMENVESIDDIINCNELGAKDKMFLIKKFDSSYYKETRDDIS